METKASFINSFSIAYGRLNMELDLQSLFGHLYTAVFIG